MQTINLNPTETTDLSYLFTQFLQYRNCQTPSANPNYLGEWLHAQLRSKPCSPLTELPFEPGTYTRTYIGKDMNTASPNIEAAVPVAEALAMRWDQQAKTSVHGHPQFSFYYVISGIFEIELFDRTAAGDLYTREIQQLLPTESTWFQGEAGRYDNCVHRVTCLEAGLTFHVYSDDALKGVVFE
ncbi:MAG: hypothetical protein AAFP03_04060 [Cyanobacteria bacterium J06598_3]